MGEKETGEPEAVITKGGHVVVMDDKEAAARGVGPRQETSIESPDDGAAALRARHDAPMAAIQNIR